MGILFYTYFGDFFQTVQTKHTSVITSVARYDEGDFKLVEQIFANHEQQHCTQKSVPEKASHSFKKNMRMIKIGI